MLLEGLNNRGLTVRNIELLKDGGFSVEVNSEYDGSGYWGSLEGYKEKVGNSQAFYNTTAHQDIFYDKDEFSEEGGEFLQRVSMLMWDLEEASKRLGK